MLASVTHHRHRQGVVIEEFTDELCEPNRMDILSTSNFGMNTFSSALRQYRPQFNTTSSAAVIEDKIELQKLMIKMDRFL
jgi:hypothetical protein